MRQAISTVFVAPPAEQQFLAFATPLQTLLVKRLHALRRNPRPPGVMKLAGVDHLYRIREAGYRIVYAIREQDLVVLAIKSSARTEVPRF